MNRNVDLRPVTREEARSFIRDHHRHHGVPIGWLWLHGCHSDDGQLAGVAVVGRPVSRELDDGLTMEVTRLATLGTANACSLLYGAARRAAIAKGYRRGLTYILASESGASLRAAGWHFLWHVEGRSWNRRVARAPTSIRPRTRWPTDGVLGRASKGLLHEQ